MLVKDYFLSEEYFEVVPHPKYDGVLQTLINFPLEELNNYYQSDQYLSHSNQKKSLMAYAYNMAQKVNFRWKERQISKRLSGGKILDYGCGIGQFVAHLNQNNFQAFGFEPNPTAATLAQKNAPKQILTWNEIEMNAPYDAISLWHVLEHIPDLEEKFEYLISLLSKHGFLYIALPNFNSFDANFYGDKWAAYDVPRHLWHFSRPGFSTFCENFGIVMEEQVGMRIDAYYVSLLSEKYKRSSLAYWNAIQMGWKSNRLARKNGDFSSILYVLSSQNGK